MAKIEHKMQFKFLFCSSNVFLHTDFVGGSLDCLKDPTDNQKRK